MKETERICSILEGTRSHPPNLMIVSKEGLGIISKGDYREVGSIDYNILKSKFSCSLFTEEGIDLHCLGKLITLTSKELFELELSNNSETIISKGYTDADLYIGTFSHLLHGKRKIIQDAYLVDFMEELSLEKGKNGYSLLINGQKLDKNERIEYRGLNSLLNKHYGVFYLEKITTLYNVQKRSAMPEDRTSKIFR